MKVSISVQIELDSSRVMKVISMVVVLFHFLHVSGLL